MENPKLTIKIGGYVGTGKSAIALLISKTLRDNGIYSEIVDDDCSEEEYVRKNLGECLGFLRSKKLKCDIQTVQLKRCSL